MKSRIITGAAIALFVASMSVPGRLPAQELGQLGPGTTFKTLVVFEGPNGGQPYDSLVQGPDGNLYGTAEGGGAYTLGTVFKMTPGGTLTTLYSFCSHTNCPDGNAPEAALVLGADGKFYGTTYAGGANVNVCPYYGCGTIFSITSAGTLTTLYSFCAKAGCADGAAPGALVQGRDGNFYGTTQDGGSASCVNTCGTVFKITPAGVLTTLYSFTGNAKYPIPSQGLVQAPDGNFYGTTPEGGRLCPYDQYGCGTVYKITPQGVLTILHSFTGAGSEGAGPSGTLIQARDGSFYGTTSAGGTGTGCNFFYGCGTVYKMTPQGTFTTLADLNNNDGEGTYGVIQATDGNFYGATAYGGGACNCGAIFEVTPEGVVTPLHSFTPTGGFIPVAGLFQATNGGFFGTTSASGPGRSYGVVYSLSVGLGPFINFVPATGKTGRAVKILGNGLTGATSVTFNGTAAEFTVTLATEITTTVPAGATTGPVEVTLPSGTLLSNVSFQVLQ